jgi:hypothetical protein
MLQRGFARAAVPDDAAVHVSELVARLRRGVLRATRAPLAVTRGRPGSASALSSVSFVGDAESSLGDPKSSLGDAKSSLGDAKSSLGVAESSLGDAESSLGDAESSLGDAESSLGDPRPPWLRLRSRLGELRG